MKRFRIAVLAALALALSAAARPAADITGTWVNKVSLTGGPTLTQTFVFKQAGEKLTGTHSGAIGEGTFTGTVTGDKVTFGWSDAKSPAITYEYTGTVQSNKELKGTVKFPKGGGEWTATRKE